MPQPVHQWEHEAENQFIAEQLNYDVRYEQEQATICVQKLNDEQRAAFQEIVHSVNQRHGQTFFVNGPGGTGKTFLYNTLCHQVSIFSDG